MIEEAGAISGEPCLPGVVSGELTTEGCLGLVHYLHLLEIPSLVALEKSQRRNLDYSSFGHKRFPKPKMRSNQ